MRLLLDTNILLALATTRLDAVSAPLRDVVTSRENSRFSSLASLWEIAIKRRINKLETIPPAELATLLETIGIVWLPITRDHVTADLDPWPATRDPFDRLLLAVCQVEGLRLVTLDRALSAHPLAWR
jgi:PIN domain nuclease of toxin-antitoxin system